MAEGSLKRKRPPTFPHHPAARAKKLKQDWVVKAKIKSKWKAEKRKMAAASVGDDKDMQDVNSDSSAPSNTQEDSTEDRQPSPVPPPPRTKSIAQKATVPEQTTSSESPISVREMKRNAYSKSSLHSYKADPFNKRKSGSVRGQSFKGDRDRNGDRGKGQPNMKLRMNAMLEKIKRDLV
ncbi:hypothetical protein EDD85DRAFT_950105 [Armillaria nabsnona]|nr:hypothetical protein EDD85DRAFT_950105 [Armillaria nabsnona]